VADGKRLTSFEGLIDEIRSARLATTGGRSAESASAGQQVKSLMRRDYRAPLRKALGRWEIRQLISEGRRRVWPNLNEQPLRAGSPREFQKAWSPLGIEFRFANLSSPEGLALFGFYIRRVPKSKRSLICVNTAHHQVAVSTAFAHEMGHHLTSEMFARTEEPLLMSYTGFGEHLEDPPELAADVLVSLGIYPRRVVRSFEESWNAIGGKRQRQQRSIAGAVEYITNQYGLDFGTNPSSAKRWEYLAGLVHYTKLRQALLDEYDL